MTVVNEEKFEEIVLMGNDEEKDYKILNLIKRNANNSNNNFLEKFNNNESTINNDNESTYTNNKDVTLNLSEINENNREQKFYHEFMDNNKEFFEKIGFKDISTDRIFFLSEEQKPRKGANLNQCDVCRKEASRFFSSPKNCKFCGNILCDNCSKHKRKIPFSDQDKLSLICTFCENKFLNISIHGKFKEDLIKKEFEITEMNQKLESLSLSCSEQLDEMNKLNDKIIAKKKENNLKEEVIQNEINSLKFREIAISSNSEKVNLKINEAINNLKILDEKKNNLEKQLANVQREREDITFDFDNRQNFFDDLNKKINEMSIKIRNFEQEKAKKARETGNSKLDFLLREKINMQRKSVSHLHSNDSSIILNPSKCITEVLKEPLLGNCIENQEEPKTSKRVAKRDSISVMSEVYHSKKKEGLFKRIVFYFGEKIFMKD